MIVPRVCEAVSPPVCGNKPALTNFGCSGLAWLFLAGFFATFLVAALAATANACFLATAI